MKRRPYVAFLFGQCLLLPTAAVGQTPRDIIGAFSGIVQSAIGQANMREWRQLPLSQQNCIDQVLVSRGSSLVELVQKGFGPRDPRISDVITRCANEAKLQNGPPATSAGPTNYVIDGLALGGKVRVESDQYKQYSCTPSEQFEGFNWCQRKQQEAGRNGAFSTSNSILHGADGTAAYINKYIEPAFFAPNEIQIEIDRLSTKFGPASRTMRLSAKDHVPAGAIFMWGTIQLEPLNAADLELLSSGKTPSKSLLIDYLGDFQKSAKAALPIFRISGGAGYIWSASYDENGKGHLRFTAADARSFGGRPPLATVQQSAPNGQIISEPSSQTQSNPARIDIVDNPPAAAADLFYILPYDERHQTITVFGNIASSDEMCAALQLPAFSHSLEDYPLWSREASAAWDGDGLAYKWIAERVSQIRPLSCTRFRRHLVRCFMEQEVRHGEKAVYAGVQA